MKTENRKEYKLVLNENEMNEFFNRYGNDLESIYSPRIIKSLYFDTLNFSLYEKSKFYDVDTYKFRIRTYPNKKKYFKEIKFNTSNGKKKLVEELNAKSFKNVEQTSFRGTLLYPSLFTEYKRQYFAHENCRITIDTSIKVYSHQFRSKVSKENHFQRNILEFKMLTSNPNIEKYIFKNPEAFSKYKYGVEKLYYV